MKASKKCIDLIRQFEGLRLRAYKCPAGYWTIGYGHTAGVREGQTITQEQADAFLAQDMAKFERAVEKYSSRYRWSQDQFDALVSFAYNVGSIGGLTKNGTRSADEIAAAMPEYNKGGAGGAKKILPGLVRRREAERRLFLGGRDAPPTEEGIETFSAGEDGEKRISRNFRVGEFRCKDGADAVLVDTGFVRGKLQGIRDRFNAPVSVHSAYRTESYNREVGGAAGSYHMKGRAFDISVKGRTPQEVARCAQELGIPGIIQYNTFVHVDSRKGKYWARNDNGKVSVVNGF